MTYYFLQSRLNDHVQTVGHSKDEETGEIYTKFINRKDCKKLMLDEMKVSPEYEYRIMKVIERVEVGKWEKLNSEQSAQVSDTTKAKSRNKCQ
jgi:hypothetical protein